MTTTSRLAAKKNNCYNSEGRIMRKIFNFNWKINFTSHIFSSISVSRIYLHSYSETQNVSWTWQTNYTLSYFCLGCSYFRLGKKYFFYVKMKIIYFSRRLAAGSKNKLSRRHTYSFKTNFKSFKNIFAFFLPTWS